MPRNKKIRNELIRKENEHRAGRHSRLWFRRGQPARAIIGTSGGKAAKILRGQKKRVFGKKGVSQH